MIDFDIVHAAIINMQGPWTLVSSTNGLKVLSRRLAQ